MQRLILGVLACWLVAVSAGAQTDPLSRPLLDASTVRGDGSFQLPAGANLDYGSAAMGVSEDGQALYVSCVFDSAGIAKVRIPAIGGTAALLEKCGGPSKAQLDSIHPTNPGANPASYGGILEIGGRLIVSAFIAYDADGGASRTYWSGPSIGALAGPYSTSGVTNGFLKGAIVPLPTEWRALLGGYEAMHCDRYSSIIGRGSFTPACSLFHPADVTKDGVPMRLLFACRITNSGCDTYQQNPGRLGRYEGAERLGAYFIAPGTRTLVVIAQDGLGPSCYGYATTDKSLQGQEHPGADPAKWCYSLESTDHNWGKGPKAYPYVLTAWLIDMRHVVEAFQGTRQPWDVRPYAAVPLPGSHDELILWGGAYNPVTNQAYYVTAGGRVGSASNQRLTVNVLSGWGMGANQPPPPTHTRARAIGSDSAWQSAWIANAKATLAAGAQPKLAGKVLHVGDSMTVSQAYGAWAIASPPAGATAEDRTALAWMRATEPAPANGWQLSWQAVTAANSLAWQSSLIDGLLTDVRTKDAQYVVWQLHTPDADPRNVSAVEARIKQFAAVGMVSVLTTVPPRVGAGYDDTVTKPYNAALRALAQRMGVPLIDLYAEIDARRPNGTWAGTLIDPDGVHLSGRAGGYDWSSNPYTPGGNADGSVTGDATLHSGYLLRTWLTAAKLGQIRALVGTSTPVDCVGTWGAWGRVVGSESACVEGRRTYQERRDFAVQTPASGGGAACPASPELRTQAEACSTSPTLTLTATGSTRTCTLVLAANQPPDASAGWGVQFARRLDGDDVWTPHGTRDALAPYTRSASVPLGKYEAQAIWSRTGATPVPVPALATWECQP